MRKLAVVLTLAFIGAAFALAPVSKAQESGAVKAPATEKAVPHSTTGDAALVVSVAEDGSTITIQGAPDNQTLAVNEKARARVKTLKAGDKVRLTLDDKGAVSDAKVLAPRPLQEQPHQ